MSLNGRSPPMASAENPPCICRSPLDRPTLTYSNRLYATLPNRYSTTIQTQPLSNPAPTIGNLNPSTTCRRRQCNSPRYNKPETPHLPAPSLIAICDWESNGKQHDETPTVYKTPSLPLRPMLRAPQPSASDTVRRSLPWRRGFQPRPNPRRWSFQLRHAGAARRRTSLCLRTAQRRPLSPLLQPLQGAVVVVAVCHDDSASPRSGETSRLAVSDAGRIRPPAVYRPFPLLNSQTPRLPAAKAIPVPMGSSAKSPVKRPFRGVPRPVPSADSPRSSWRCFSKTTEGAMVSPL